MDLEYMTDLGVESLGQPNLAADVRIEGERKVEDLVRDVGMRSREEKEKKNMQKYKMVRFVEWKKTMRKIRQVKAMLSEDDDGKEEGEKRKRKLERLRIDLNYIVVSVLKAGRTPHT